MSEQLQFDFAERIQTAKRAGDEGIKKVALNNKQFLDRARSIAIACVYKKGYATVDDIRDKIEIFPTHKNAWGAVFHHYTFKFAGMEQSRVSSNHGRWVRKWVLV